ncbi:LysM peptidoglycan-binding domain-containing protein [Enterococcus canintestini]|uniref:LysM peptidoglycan-binding domain-containing protein n=1 Tax=Enterococcus canintestini TaxID=317010 RepID=UPI0028921DD0|nr:LysM peptidoglycan-binding domain-containing protein [Enterococcus canintestini]MDT2740076.1 LysM peptidoglycan-binding domain-containing protein [Enterococcus canintestini]
MTQLVSRKERRKEEKQIKFYRDAKKSAAIVGTTLTACSVVAPLAKPVTAEATSNNQAQISRDLSQTSSRSNSTALITELAAHAQPVAAANDLYASVMIAQAIVESGWGTSSLSRAPYYNLFGIKGSYNGKTVYMNTLEYLNGKWVTMKEPFRDYPSYKESFADNAATLRNVYIGGQYYYRGAWKSNTSSYRDATAWLTGRYATAPNYASALNSVIESYGLTRYDTPASGNAGGGAWSGGSGSTNNNSSSGSSSSVSQYYTVQSGDSVWGIANKYGISMNNLISWNNIKNNFIYPGQRLVVKKGTSGSTTTNETPSKPTQNNNKPSGNTTSSSATQYYTVQSGDSVWGISNKYNISMSSLVSWNNIKNNFIYPGQRLVVKKGTSGSTTTNNTPSKPAQNTNKPSTNKPANTNNSSGKTYYTVQSGDSVWGISNKYGISMNTLVNWNNIKNNFIYPGQRLVVKNGSASTTNNKPAQNTTAAKPNNNTNTSNTGNSGQNRYYTIQSGDSVWAVANKYKISMDQFRQWNNIKNDFIYPGQKVIVKKGSVQGVQAQNSSSQNNSKTYQVQSGDSVWGIADKFGITMDKLIQLNKIQNNFIYPGQTLKVK